MFMCFTLLAQHNLELGNAKPFLVFLCSSSLLSKARFLPSLLGFFLILYDCLFPLSHPKANYFIGCVSCRRSTLQMKFNPKLVPSFVKQQQLNSHQYSFASVCGFVLEWMEYTGTPYIFHNMRFICLQVVTTMIHISDSFT